jgi:hypothetical protein
VWLREEDLDLGAQGWLVGLDRQQVAGARRGDCRGDGGIAGEGVDADDGVLEGAALGQGLD